MSERFSMSKSAFLFFLWFVWCHIWQTGKGVKMCKEKVTLLIDSSKLKKFKETSKFAGKSQSAYFEYMIDFFIIGEIDVLRQKARELQRELMKTADQIKVLESSNENL